MKRVNTMDFLMYLLYLQRTEIITASQKNQLIQSFQQALKTPQNESLFLRECQDIIPDDDLTHIRDILKF